MSVTVNAPIVVSGLFDGGGKTYRRGSSLADGLIFKVGAGATLQNCVVDDADYAGVSGVIGMSGDGPKVLNNRVINLRRYGIITQGCSNFRIVGNELLSCQHGISGATGYDGQWAPSSDGVVENNKVHVRGLNPQHGIKLKNWLNVMVQYNHIDAYGKTGIVFAGGDSSTVDCTVRDNTITNTSGVVAGTGIAATPLGVYTASTGPRAGQPVGAKFVPGNSGNHILNNSISNFSRGIHLRDNNFYVDENTFMNCRANIVNEGLNNNIDPEGPVEPPPTPPPVEPPPVIPPVEPPPVTPPPVVPPVTPPPVAGFRWIPLSFMGMIIYLMAKEAKE